MLALARLYRDGQGGDKDLAAAARWTETAAKTGDPAAQEELGNLFRLGSGVEPDLAHARDLYKKAAEQGYAPAENDLGMMYRFGGGGDIDYERALGWLFRAADHGVAAAKFNIAVIYALGLGGSQRPRQGACLVLGRGCGGRPKHQGSGENRVGAPEGADECGRNRQGGRSVGSLSRHSFSLAPSLKHDGAAARVALRFDVQSGDPVDAKMSEVFAQLAPCGYDMHAVEIG